MSIEQKTEFGAINISFDAIATVAGNATQECYGVIGLTSKGSIHDVIAELLKTDNYSRGITVNKDKSGAYNIDVCVVIAYDVKITEVLSEIQKKVKYVLQKTFDINIKRVNVFAHSLKKVD